VDLRNDARVAALASVFKVAAKAYWAILVHLRTERGDYGGAEVQRSIKDVLPAAAGTPVQIAHAGGWGGIDKVPLSALGSFADSMQSDPLTFRHLWFDLPVYGRIRRRHQTSAPWWH
jgi:hypothetical protein